MNRQIQGMPQEKMWNRPSRFFSTLNDSWIGKVEKRKEERGLEEGRVVGNGRDNRQK